MSKKKRELQKAAAQAAATAQDFGQNAWEETLTRVNDILNETQKKVGPYAKKAKKETAKFASKRLDAWEPHIKSAMDKVAPAVDAAKDKVADDYLPRLQHLLHEAADHPLAKEATRRGEAAVQALKGELEPVKKKSKLAGFAKFLGIVAIIGGAVAAIRHFLTPKDDGWTAHEPSRAYWTSPEPAANAADTAKDAKAEEPQAEVKVVAEDELSDQEDMTAEGAPAPQEQLVSDEEATAAEGDNSYEGLEGTYVGENPPEGYEIKGNERSKKYHVPGGNGYDRTIAEVWFNSEEAAEAAGFTKAQR